MNKDDSTIFGTWQAVTGTLAGDSMPGEIVSATKLTISETSYEVDLAGNIDSGSCQIQLDTQPIKLKIEGENGPNAGKTFLAILEVFDTDQIRLAYDLSGTEYPTSFVPKSESSSYVATFKRI